MKSRLLLFMLALFAVEVSVTHANPTSTGSQNAVATADNHGIYLESYTDDFHDHYDLRTNGVLGGTFDHYFTIKWANGGGGTNISRWVYTGIAAPEWWPPENHDSSITNAWPATKWPQALPVASGIPIPLSFDGGPGNLIAGHNAYMGLQWCAAKFTKTYTAGESSDVQTFEETGQAKMTLATGGKPGSTKQSLWMISASATPRAFVPSGSVREDPPVGQQSGSIPFDQIAVGELGKLGSDGKLFVVLPDNVTKDVTPMVKNKDYYTFNVDPQNLRLELRRVNFTDSLSIGKDDGSGNYPTPHWTNDATGLIVQSSPVLYTSSNRVQTTTGFEMTGNGSFSVIIKGEASGGLTAFKLLETNSPSSEMHPVADKVLANTVDFFKPMKIKWTYAGYTTNQTSEFLDAGTSTNQVYVTWHAPMWYAKIFHTVVHVACANSVGQSGESNIVAEIWTKFTSRSVPRWNETTGMKYWGVEATNRQNSPNALDTTEELLTYADGQCGAWSLFFGDVLGANGIGSCFQQKIILTNVFPPTFVTPAGFIVKASLPGQGGTPLVTVFADHQNVFYSGRYYDPSYGVDYYFTNHLTWEDASLDSLVYKVGPNNIAIPHPKGAPLDTGLFSLP